MGYSQTIPRGKTRDHLDEQIFIRGFTCCGRQLSTRIANAFIIIDWKYETNFASPFRYTNTLIPAPGFHRLR